MKNSFLFQKKERHIYTTDSEYMTVQARSSLLFQNNTKNGRELSLSFFLLPYFRAVHLSVANGGRTIFSQKVNKTLSSSILYRNNELLSMDFNTFLLP